MPPRKRSAKRTTKARATAARRPRTAKKAAKPPITVPEGWILDKAGKSITRQVKTRNFLAAVDLINELAPVAEELNHHPDFHLERWNHLRITSYSHDVGHLTDRDERLATRINEALAKRGSAP